MKMIFKKYWLPFATIFALLMPFVSMLIVFFAISINIFDNPEFWYSYMGYFGTVILASLALWQNQVFKSENEKNNKKFMQAQIFSSCAFYKIASVKVTTFEDDNNFVILIYMRNIGKSTAVCTLPYEFEFSKFGFKIGKQSHGVILEFSDETFPNTLSNELIEYRTKPISLDKIKEDKLYFVHLTLSIVSENQMQYDQTIQLQFKKKNEKLNYEKDISTQTFKLYE